jgi:hypothetical protein
VSIRIDRTGIGRIGTHLLAALLSCALIAIDTRGQESRPPLSKSEIIAGLRASGAARRSQGDLAAEVEERGISFKADEATMEELRRAGARSFLIDAIRRAGAPGPRPQTAPPATLPSTPQSDEETREAALTRLPLIEQVRYHALKYVEELPNFTVKQIVQRYERTPTTRDWQLQDTLEIELTYHDREGEKFKLLRVNGAPAKSSYEALGGSTSTGEFGSLLGALFAPRSQATFREVRREKFRHRATVVFEFKVRTAHSTSQLTDKSSGRSVTSGYQGTLWIDEAEKRVLRIEVSHEEIPPGFPITLAENAVEYDYVTIAGQRHLLPVRAEMLLGRDRERYYTRNVIELRDYHKFETDVQILPSNDPPD